VNHHAIPVSPVGDPITDAGFCKTSNSPSHQEVTRDRKTDARMGTVRPNEMPTKDKTYIVVDTFGVAGSVMRKVLPASSRRTKLLESSARRYPRQRRTKSQRGRETRVDRSDAERPKTENRSRRGARRRNRVRRSASIRSPKVALKIEEKNLNQGGWQNSSTSDRIAATSVQTGSITNESVQSRTTTDD